MTILMVFIYWSALFFGVRFCIDWYSRKSTVKKLVAARTNLCRILKDIDRTTRSGNYYDDILFYQDEARDQANRTLDTIDDILEGLDPNARRRITRGSTSSIST